MCRNQDGEGIAADGLSDRAVRIGAADDVGDMGCGAHLPIRDITDGLPNLFLEERTLYEKIDGERGALAREILEQLISARVRRRAWAPLSFKGKMAERNAVDAFALAADREWPVGRSVREIGAGAHRRSILLSSSMEEL